jgi:hypothetical protein
MMLSTVNSNGFAAGGAERFCATTSCGAIRERTQSAKLADRRGLVFMVVSYKCGDRKVTVRY